MKHVRAQTVEDYFNLPKKEREWFGIYRKPSSMLMGQWEEFEKRILKEYPVQVFLREKVWFEISCVFGYKLKNIKHSIKNFINPNHIRYRNAYQRHKYKDIDSIIEDGMFALLKDFWYGECWPTSIVDWEDSEESRKVYQWLKDTIETIEVTLPKLCDDENKAYNEVDQTKTYHEAYAEVNRIEAEIKDIKNKILHEIIDYRDYLWT